MGVRKLFWDLLGSNQHNQYKAQATIILNYKQGSIPICSKTCLS